jgi:Na+/proline symporter
MVQRYLCAKSLGQARLALSLSGFVILAQFLLFLAVGVGMYLLATAEPSLFPDAAKAKNNDEVFPRFIIHMLPTGVVGILIAAVLAAAMSTLSSSLNSSANALVTDFYRPLRPHHSEKWYVFLSRVMTAVWGVAQMAVAYAADQIGSDQSVVYRVLAVAGATFGLVLGLFILGSLRKPVSAQAALLGLICGALAVLLAWLPSALPPNPSWWPLEWKPSALAWPWFAPIGTGTTVVIAVTIHAVVPDSRPKPQS